MSPRFSRARSRARCRGSIRRALGACGVSIGISCPDCDGTGRDMHHLGAVGAILDRLDAAVVRFAIRWKSAAWGQCGATSVRSNVTPMHQPRRT